MNNDINFNSNILIVGQRQTGKNWIIINTLNNIINIKRKIVISKTEKDHQFYSKIFNDLEVHENLDVLNNKILSEKDGILIIIDEFRKEYYENILFRDIIINGRQYNISVILTVENLFELRPEIRCNCDYIFLLGSENNELEKIYFEFKSFFSSFEEFIKLYNDFTVSFYCMVIDIKGKIFKYKFN